MMIPKYPINFIRSWEVTILRLSRPVKLTNNTSSCNKCSNKPLD